MEITARVRQSTHPHQGAERARLARHIVLDVPLEGRLRREAGDALCRPATDFYELEHGDVEGDATCRKCIERAARYGVRVITAPAPAAAPTPKRDEPSDTWTITNHADVEIARVEGATVEDMTRAAEALPIVRDTINAEGGFFRRRLYTSELLPADTEQRAVEGVVVAHAGEAEGSAPADATHPDVVAAREALAGLAAATLTDHHNHREPTSDERTVRGYVIEPRGQGRVALYWMEGGKNVRRDEIPDGPALDCLADRMMRRGWAVERMLRSSQCVFAHRPTEDAAPAAVKPAEDRCKECAGKGCHWCYWTGEQQPEQDTAAAELRDTVDTVEEAERADGTWRGGWIAGTTMPADEVLFNLGGEDVGQGALFTS
ncbi:hypothetical protein [Streptomyces sp. NPDC004296]|uniref:hypothetical protein n=1 Tax=Streptomyces sp. NPDC004296 TaxID=3364697 RepID=UPI00368093F4